MCSSKCRHKDSSRKTKDVPYGRDTRKQAMRHQGIGETAKGSTRTTVYY